ncbi:BTB/POZ fold protein [Apiospora arundinis]|uniref:BTB/POZ fold protein n=1 Tax=Apiospora arundinis TaxID=335852 RepID=A0ABR2JJ36_9PEZI
MAALSQSIAASGPFRFLVGPEKKEYMMHTELVASLSKPLRALLTNGMEESCKRVAEWPEVEETTFVRFFQFAYTGQFDAEEPEKPPPKTPEPLEDHDLWPGLSQNSNMTNFAASFQRKQLSTFGAVNETKMNIQGQKKAKLWESFQQAYEPLKDSPARWPLPDQDPTSDFTRVFLAYARLYVLADEKDVQGLAELSLRRLHHTLVHFNIQGQRADSIASLADYCFENTCDKGGEQDKMRHLICLFTACHFETLWTNSEFQRVFTELREFLTGVIGLMLPRLD